MVSKPTLEERIRTNVINLVNKGTPFKQYSNLSVVGFKKHKVNIKQSFWRGVHRGLELYNYWKNEYPEDNLYELKVDSIVKGSLYQIEYILANSKTIERDETDEQ